jgi:hypothetical protein
MSVELFKVGRGSCSIQLKVDYHNGQFLVLRNPIRELKYCMSQAAMLEIDSGLNSVLSTENPTGYYPASASLSGIQLVGRWIWWTSPKNGERWFNLELIDPVANRQQHGAGHFKIDLRETEVQELSRILNEYWMLVEW